MTTTSLYTCSKCKNLPDRRRKGEERSGEENGIKSSGKVRWRITGMGGDSGNDYTGPKGEAEFYDLALRLLSGSGRSAAEALLVGRLPQQWPTELSITEDYFVIGSLVMSVPHPDAHADAGG